MTFSLFQIHFRFPYLALQLCFCLLFTAPLAKAAQQPVIETFQYRNIGRQVSFFIDKTAKLELNQITSAPDTRFKLGTQNILNFGNTTAACWVKIKYKATKNATVYLIIDAPNIEYIDAYIIDKQQKITKINTGSLVKRKPNEIDGNSFMLSLPISAEDEHRTIFLRLKTNNILLVPIKLATPAQVITGRDVKGSIEYIYIGLLIGLLLYNLFLFISIKDITYLYYVLYVFTLSCYLLIYIRGYGYLFGDELRILFNQHPHVFLSLSVITSLIFCGKFLHLSAMAKKMTKFFYALGIIGVVLFFTSVFGFKHISVNIAQFLTVTVALVVWIAGIIAYKNGHQPGKYYILAWFFIWITVAIVTLSLGGIIEPSELTIQLIPIGSAFELLLLSFALGDRYKVIIQMEKQVRDENLLLIKTQNQRLEERVNERTLQLSSTVEELENANSVKNKLFSIIAHDLRSPLNSLKSILSLNDMQALTPEELRTLLAENKNSIDSIYNTLNNLLHWAHGQMKGLITDVSQFKAKALLEELLLLYVPLIKKKNIRIVLLAEEEIEVLADENQIHLVLRNLIDNAIKFTPVHGRITIALKSTAQRANFNIQNEVANLKEVQMEQLVGDKITNAAYGTQNEKGIGLGLLLCYEYVKNNGDQLKVDLTPEGIAFSFSIPKSLH
jgi:signal transduction histidine kinase